MNFKEEEKEFLRYLYNRYIKCWEENFFILINKSFSLSSSIEISLINTY